LLDDFLKVRKFGGIGVVGFSYGFFDTGFGVSWHRLLRRNPFHRSELY